MNTKWLFFLGLLVPLFVCGRSTAQKPDLKKAATYLDKKQSDWFSWRSSRRGSTRCVACHTNLTYALVRTELSRATDGAHKVFRESLLKNTKSRLADWDNIRVSYGGNKTDQSRGTEAILNVLTMVKQDRASGRRSISQETRQAFEILWKHQIRTGDQAGSWHWLDFGLEPWESEQGAYYGAAIAAIAIGQAPTYATESSIKQRLKALRRFLLNVYGDAPSGNPKLSLYNRTYLLWASQELSGLLGKQQQTALIKELFKKQNSDGGWALPSLGSWKRKDGTAQSSSSDGYATGLVVYTLLRSGVKKDDTRLKKGIRWISQNQNADGSWTGISVNKDRSRSREPVKSFFTHAATALSTLAWIESQK